MYIKAFKMDGLGNDFVIIDQRNKNLNLNKDQIIKICDRNYIGCDQLILIKKNKKIDAGLEFYNSDGSISGACGNGTRCVAKLLAKENNKKEIVLWTSAGVLKSQILGNNLVETEIGVPKTNWNEIPLSKKLNTKDLKIEITDEKKNKHVGGIAVNVGTAACASSVKRAEVPATIATKARIENVNLDDDTFMLFIISINHIYLK